MNFVGDVLNFVFNRVRGETCRPKNSISRTFASSHCYNTNHLLGEISFESSVAGLQKYMCSQQAIDVV